MTKFLTVNKAPEKLEKGEYVIEMPDFLPEILMCGKQKPKTGVITTHYLRLLVSTVGQKYIGPRFNEMTALRYSNYDGVPFDSDKAVSKILLQSLKNEAPGIIMAYIDYQIKNRPQNIQLIYFVGGSSAHAQPFYNNGIDPIDAKHVDEYMGRKKKKTVGRPAVKSKE